MSQVDINGNGLSVDDKWDELLVRVTYNDVVGVKDILEYNDLDVNAGNGHIITMACASGQLSILEVLVEYGADLEVNYGAPLTLACKNNQINIIKYFAENGFDFNHNDAFSFQSAILNNNIDIVSYILENDLLSEKNRHIDPYMVSKYVIKDIDIHTFQYLFDSGFDVVNDLGLGDKYDTFDDFVKDEKNTRIKKALRDG